MARLNATLGRGTSGGTVTTAPPAASDRSASQSNGAYGEFVAGVGDVTQGRISLIILDTLILALVAFYIVTHRSQGGG